MDFCRLVWHFRRLSFEAFRRQMTQAGRDLAERGAPLENVLTGIHQLFEICVPCLTRDPAEPDSSAIALARLASLACTLVASGYDRHWDTSRKRLQASLAKAGHLSRGASAYVTQIYEVERRRFSPNLH